MTDHNDTSEGINDDNGEFDIAIIGMAGRFPKAANLNAFWQNLVNGVNSTTFASEQALAESELDAADYQHKDFVNASLNLEAADQFDAEFFNVSVADAVMMDPQIRLMLQTCWHTLEDSGYNSFNYQGSIGNFSTMGSNTYLLRQSQVNPGFSGYSPLQTRILNDKDFLATQVSYKLNLTGPAMSVQTACSSSLLAVHLACQSLLNNECDMALAGGAQVDAYRSLGYQHVKGSIVSPDGYCRAFDVNAQGMVPGDGIGMVLLKKLNAALADGDNIYAVIRGSAANNDGSDKMAYTAPSVDAQRDVIVEALSVADVDAGTIGLVEAHGTATALGDPAEITAISEAFRQESDANQYCAIGSVKTNIGHLDTASGIAGLIKAALCVYHGRFVPSLNFSQPNPALGLEKSPFYVCKGGEWSSQQRRAGVSSFGVGGTNVHVVLEQAPAKSANITKASSIYMVPLSARTEQGLAELKTQLSQHIEQNPALDLADIAFTLLTGRHQFNHCFTAICQNKDQLVQQLRGETPDNCEQSISDGKTANTVFMYPGQGSQFANMAQGLYRDNAVFKQQLDRCGELASKYITEPLNSLIFSAELSAELSDELSTKQATDKTQLAIFAVQYCLSKVWQSWGITPKAVTGHSLGEYTAACISGVITLEEAIKLVYWRGKLMAQMQPGSMLAVSMPLAQLQPLLLDGVEIAAVNGPAHIVLSATTSAIEAQQQILANQEIKVKTLNTSHAFHSQMMQDMLAQFKPLLAEVDFQAPKIPFYSTVTGERVSDSQLCQADYWLQQIRQPVLFAQAIEHINSKVRRAVFVEVGPGRALSTFVKAISDNPMTGNSPAISCLTKSTQTSDTSTELLGLYAAKAKLWQNHAVFDKPQIQERHNGRTVSLPGYAFQTQSYWMPDTRQQNPGFAAATQTAQTETGQQSLKLGVQLTLAENSEGLDDDLQQGLADIHATFLQQIESLMADHGLHNKNNASLTLLREGDLSGQIKTVEAAPLEQKARLTNTLFVAPQSDVEQKIALHWQQVLGYQPVGKNDNYFDVGGDSLTATTLLGKIEAEFNIELSFEDISGAQTITELGKMIELRLWLSNSDDDQDIIEDDDEEVFEI